jgi:phage terminase large subunit GpA-like protein
MKGAATDVYAGAAWDGLEPEPLLTVSEWADRHRMLSQRASAEAGRWRTDRTPYLREIMDALSPSSPVEQVVFMKGAQVGGTEAGNNWLAYVIDYAPGPMMAVAPTVELAKRNSKHRIDPLIAECPRLASKVKDPRTRDGGNTVLSKEFPGGILIMTGANSAVGLRSMPVRYLFLDEVDAYPADLDGEGSPLELALARTRTFARRKVLMVSTPTIMGRSRIEDAYSQTDQRRYHVPCPDCGKTQVLRWSNLRWDSGKPETARYSSEGCGVLLEEHQKTEMLANGTWVPANEGASERTRGYQLSSLYSPLGWFSWADAAAFWERAKKRPQELRVFVNTVLGESWQERGDAPDWKRLYQRREPYRARSVPRGGLVLTAGVDVQKDRLEIEIVAWGRGLESWSIDHRVIEGDTADTAIWGKLDALLSETFDHELGGKAQVARLAVDSGFRTATVYNWSRRHESGRVMAVKGTSGLQMLVGSPARVDVNMQGERLRRGAIVWPVGVDIAKGELYGALRLEPPLPGEPTPPGYCHFPEDYGQEYFQQLTAEELVPKVVRGYRRHEWTKVRERNEALDCRVYARAAAGVLGIERYSDAHWTALEEQLSNVPAPERRVRPRREQRSISEKLDDLMYRRGLRD